jgi:lipid-binding SYLF domain-containing protein
MSAPSPDTNQPAFRQYPATRHSSAQNGKQDLVKLAKGLALISSALAVLTVGIVIGIVIGNAARKRIDRWAHGFS